MSIKSAREKAGITQAVIADAVNVSRAAVSAWESGKALPEAAKLPVIANLCGCTVDDLLAKDNGG